jgi:hypothetical protein
MQKNKEIAQDEEPSKDLTSDKNGIYKLFDVMRADLGD